MGDRCIITSPRLETSLYLHWMGHPSEVVPLLRYCELAGYRSPDTDDSYGVARLAQVASNYYGAGGLGVGVCSRPWVSGLDNGIYVVKNWKIAAWYQTFNDPKADPIPAMDWYYGDMSLDVESLEEKLREIDTAQPYHVEASSLTMPQELIDQVETLNIYPVKTTTTGKWKVTKYHPKKLGLI